MRGFTKLATRALPILALLFFGLMVSAAAFNGFYDKWGFRENKANASLQTYFDGTTFKPFAFRRLVPDIADAIDRALPRSVHDKTAARLVNNGFPILHNAPPVALREPYVVRYHIVYYAMFGCFCALFAAMYACGRQAGTAPLAAFAAAAGSILIFPYFQSIGGYFYDYSEYLLFLLLLIAARRGAWPAMLLLGVLGGWNKESFLFFVPTIWPFLPERWSSRSKTAIIGGVVALAAIAYEVQRLRFAGNGGTSGEFHWIEHLQFLISPSTLFGHEQTYGVVGPTPFNILFLLAIAGVALRGWSRVEPLVRTHIKIAMAINIPLYVVLGFPGEIRGLSMLAPGLLLLGGAALASWHAEPLERDRNSPKVIP